MESTPDYGRDTLMIRPDAVMDPPGMARWWPVSSSLSLGALLGATPCARLHTRAVLAEWGLHDIAEAAELAVSEIVTNAVQASTDSDGQPRYGEDGLPVVILRLSTDYVRVLIEVWDDHPQAPAAARAGPDDENGRGLTLVEAVCDRWSWHTVPGRPGKVVWAELRVHLHSKVGKAREPRAFCVFCALAGCPEPATIVDPSSAMLARTGCP
jgi:anti-sigma regulatory factor (Ser/Thr protein kinase)